MLKVRGRTWWQKNCKNRSNSGTIEKWNPEPWSDIHFGESPVEKADNDGLQEIWMHFVKALFIFMSFPIFIDLGNESFLGKKWKVIILIQTRMLPHIYPIKLYLYLANVQLGFTYLRLSKSFLLNQTLKKQRAVPCAQSCCGGKQKIPINREYWNYFIRKYE